ncbi:hypothetical protein HMPREF9151_00858 [Hoylesella saccharolytica F0055]|uniref:Uncharacterized protein n=1 Tax=Hoylesella saccharolytica F0055 TaxID=1127699 RepID=L1NFE5_9BACT|nr:hypothetical protein HMPREF9151_00858 [Hoylesella saccharolytica F0055]
MAFRQKYKRTSSFPYSRKATLFLQEIRKSKYNVLCKYIFGNVKQLAEKLLHLCIF